LNCGFFGVFTKENRKRFSTNYNMSNQSKNLRLISLDALRGFDMFWIMSGEHIIHALAETTHIQHLSGCPNNCIIQLGTVSHFMI
jgi:hypothetical protein